MVSIELGRHWNTSFYGYSPLFIVFQPYRLVISPSEDLESRFTRRAFQSIEFKVKSKSAGLSHIHINNL